MEKWNCLDCLYSFYRNICYNNTLTPTIDQLFLRPVLPFCDLCLVPNLSGAFIPLASILISVKTCFGVPSNWELSVFPNIYMELLEVWYNCVYTEQVHFVMDYKGKIRVFGFFSQILQSKIRVN